MNSTSTDEWKREFYEEGFTLVCGALSQHAVDQFVEAVSLELAHGNANQNPVSLTNSATWPRGNARRVFEAAPLGGPDYWNTLFTSPVLGAALDAVIGEGAWELNLNQQEEGRHSDDDNDAADDPPQLSTAQATATPIPDCVAENKGATSSSDRRGMQHPQCDQPPLAAGDKKKEAPKLSTRHWYVPVAFPEQPPPQVPTTTVTLAAGGGGGGGGRGGGGGGGGGEGGGGSNGARLAEVISCADELKLRGPLSTACSTTATPSSTTTTTSTSTSAAAAAASHEDRWQPVSRRRILSKVRKRRAVLVVVGVVSITSSLIFINVFLVLQFMSESDGFFFMCAQFR